MSKAIEMLKALGLSDDEAKAVTAENSTADVSALVKKVHKAATPVILESEEVQTKVKAEVGKATGTLQSKLKKALDLSGVSIAGDGDEWVANLGEVVKAKITGGDAELKKINEALQAKVNDLETNVIPGIKNEYAAKEKGRIVNDHLLNSISSLELTVSDRPKALKAMQAATDYKFDADDEGNVWVLNADGTKAKKPDGTAFLTPDEVLKQAASDLGWIKQSNAQTGGLQGGKDQRWPGPGAQGGAPDPSKMTPAMQKAYQHQQALQSGQQT